MLRQGDVGEIYNIGAGNERTNREITDAVLAALGQGRVLASSYVEDRQGHDRRYSIATDKVDGARLDARAHASTTRSRRPSRWYVDNRAWWEPLRARVKNR